VAAGGQLVVLGGPDWQARTAAFESLLPVEHIASRDGGSAAAFAAWAGAEAPDGTDPLTISDGDLRAGAVGLVSDDAGRALFAAISRGAGRVGFVGIDLATEPFRAWAGAPSLWTRLIPDDRLIEQWGGFGSGDDNLGSMMGQALANLPSLAVPPAELLLAVIVGYILLIGPVTYLVLRRLDRRELAWIVAPVLVIVFSAVSYGIGASMKGSQIIVNQIAVVRSSTDGTSASVSTYAGIFSPTRATYDLTVRGEALLSALLVNAIDPALGGQQVVNYATEQGEPAHLRGLAVSVFGLQAVRADAVIPYAPSLRVSWAVTAANLEGRATNDGTARMEDVAVISQNGGVMIGTLAPGESKSFSMPLRNFNGSSASQQVYGSLGFDTSTAAQRRIMVRSQVIDGLVGYGGGFPGKAGGIGGIDQGPFVIGWRADESPLEVEVDGQQIQRYAQAVEVLSGRATLGPGPVVISPADLSTEIVAVAGEASQTEPGFATIGNGEVTFRIGLPLEATGLVPTKVTIIAASDPGAILYDQEDVGPFLASGYRIAVYDTAAAAWVDLGDLSVRSRFEVTDPLHVIDAAGRILVRIVGSGLPDDFAPSSVFAGARVNGVIAE
jgi:hypothetical protein